MKPTNLLIYYIKYNGRIKTLDHISLHAKDLMIHSQDSNSYKQFKDAATEKRCRFLFGFLKRDTLETVRFNYIIGDTEVKIQEKFAKLTSLNENVLLLNNKFNQQIELAGSDDTRSVKVPKSLIPPSLRTAIFSRKNLEDAFQIINPEDPK